MFQQPPWSSYQFQLQQQQLEQAWEDEEETIAFENRKKESPGKDLTSLPPTPKPQPSAKADRPPDPIVPPLSNG